MRLFAFIATALTLAISLESTALASEKDKFDDLLEMHWNNVLKEQVFFRRDPDVFRMNGKLPDFSEKGVENRRKFNDFILTELEKIDSSKLSYQDSISYRLFKYEREAERASYEQIDRYFPMNIYAGFHTYFAEAPAKMSFLTAEDYDNYLVSLADYPRYNRDFIDILSKAIDKGLTHYCGSFVGYEKTISRSIVTDITQSEFYAPVANFPQSISIERQKRYERQVSDLIREKVIPEYQLFHEFFIEEYMPNCRKDVGITSVDGGKAYYDYLINFYTTTNTPAKEIHELGLSEVKRIKTAMNAIILEVNFEGDFKAFLDSLRNDPDNYADSPRDLLEKASYLAKRMEGELPKWFSVLPRGTYNIKASPGGGAYYVAGAGDGKTSGTYFLGANSYESEPLYNLEALTYHEAVPGHHFQGTIAQELDVPEFRKTLYHSAYGEGWGLYAESLGKEVGFYEDPYSDFGRLTYEMWRACRLVVDTGMHAFGWSREQAVRFLLSNTALSENDVNREVDRYISWPGQALSYKIGEIKIQNLRRKAEAELGESFDIRAFHDILVGNGSLPIAVLEDVVTDWLDEQK